MQANVKRFKNQNDYKEAFIFCQDLEGVFSLVKGAVVACK